MHSGQQQIDHSDNIPNTEFVTIKVKPHCLQAAMLTAQYVWLKKQWTDAKYNAHTSNKNVVKTF